MSTILDSEFSSWAEEETRPRRGVKEFSEYIKRGPQEKHLKYRVGENCKLILDSRLLNCTWTEVQFLASAMGARALPGQLASALPSLYSRGSYAAEK